GAVHGPAPRVEPSHQLDHLTLGAARLEAGHHDGDWNRGRRRHAPNLSKASASRVQNMRPEVPSARCSAAGGGNKGDESGNGFPGAARSRYCWKSVSTLFTLVSS